MAFLHGPEVVELDDQPRPVIVVRSAVIHLFGTAVRGPVNKPVLIAGSPMQGSLIFGDVKDGGSIPAALDGIFDVHGAVVIVTNVLDPAVHFTAVAAANHTLDSRGRVILPQAGAFGVVVKAAGGTGSALVEGTDYTFNSATRTIQRLNAGAIPASATAVSVAYSYADPSKVDIDDIIGGTDNGVYTGVHTALAAESETGFRGKIFIAPGFTHVDAGTPDTANPVVAELQGIAERMRGWIIKDGPGTSDADAIADRDNWGSRRIYLVEPHALVRRDGGPQVEYFSPRVAGLISKVHAEKGFWWSPSNQLLGQGVVGLSRPIQFGLGDQNSQANLLNERQVATVVRHEGYRLWGNQTCSDDQKWRFLSVVITNDVIAESLLTSHLWAIDRCMDKRYFEIVPESVNGFLDSLEAQGAILGGDCWVVPELNNADSIQQGHAWFDYEFTPPYPAERVTFRAHMSGRYISSIVPIPNREIASA